MLGSTLAQRSAVAPPGRRLRALRRAGEMPVVSWSFEAEERSAAVTCSGVTRWRLPLAL